MGSPIAVVQRSALRRRRTGLFLDVRAVPCSVKLDVILRTWLALPVGGHFILVNEHEPAPLRHQFAVQWPGAFTWEPMLRLPDLARVKIVKLRAVSAETADPLVCPSAAG